MFPSYNWCFQADLSPSSIIHYWFSEISIFDLDKTNFARLVTYQRDRCISLRLKENLQEIIENEHEYLQKITKYYYQKFLNTVF